jgi:hypothetical protein
LLLRSKGRENEEEKKNEIYKALEVLAWQQVVRDTGTSDEG